jgi:hypothetical protein
VVDFDGYCCVLAVYTLIWVWSCLMDCWVQLVREEFEMVVLGFRCIAPPCSMVVHGHCTVFWDLPVE